MTDQDRENAVFAATWWLAEQPFYDAMQAYRHATDTKDVVAAFQAVKALIRREIAASQPL